jgi:hypothetical protein
MVNSAIRWVKGEEVEKQSTKSRVYLGLHPIRGPVWAVDLEECWNPGLFLSIDCYKLLL